MWIITDDKGNVVDKASKEKSLSRGYMLAGVKKGGDLSETGYSKIEITEKLDIGINDTYKDRVHAVNKKYRAECELPGVEDSIILDMLMSEKADALGYVDVKATYDEKLAKSKARRDELKGIIGCG